MGRPTPPRKLPREGDVPGAAIARLMGLAPAEFAARLPELLARGFPGPDATTGFFCVEAVRRWRLLRHEPLFPDLALAAGGLPKLARSGEGPNEWDNS